MDLSSGLESSLSRLVRGKSITVSSFPSICDPTNAILTRAECHFTVMELTKVFRQSDIGFIKMLEKFRRGTCDDECVQLLKTCGSALKDEIKIKVSAFCEKFDWYVANYQ